MPLITFTKLTKATPLTTSKKDKASGVIAITDENGKLITSNRRGFAIAFQSKTIGEIRKVSPIIAEGFDAYELPDTMTLFEAQQWIKLNVIVTSKDAKAVIAGIDSNVDAIFGKVSEETTIELPESKIVDEYDVLDGLDTSEILKYMEARNAREQPKTTALLVE